MSQVNISAKDKLDDPFYRYKRDRVLISTSERFGGLTTIENWSTLCKQLKIQPQQLQKFFSKEWGCQVDVNGKIKKKLLRDNIETSLQKFTEQFLLCPTCKLPELLNSHCQSCGNGPKK